MSVNSTLDFIVDLHKRNSGALGFIPKPTMKKFIEDGQVFLKDEGGTICRILYNWEYQ